MQFDPVWFFLSIALFYLVNIERRVINLEKEVKRLSEANRASSEGKS